MKNYIREAAIVAVGLVIMGISLYCGIVKFKSMDRSVTVKGLAEREVKADKVIWPLRYKEMGNDPSAMYTLIEEKNNKVIAFLKKGGVTDDEISVNPPIVVDRQADSYGNEILNYRYKATSVVTVTSKNVDKVRKLMLQQPELMKQGIAIVGSDYGAASISYEFTQLNEIKPAMVEEATRNARATAKKFAEDSNSELGGILSAYQGTFSIEDRDENTPYIKHIRVVSTIDYELK